MPSKCSTSCSMWPGNATIDSEMGCCANVGSSARRAEGDSMPTHRRDDDNVRFLWRMDGGSCSADQAPVKGG